MGLNAAHISYSQITRSIISIKQIWFGRSYVCYPRLCQDSQVALAGNYGLGGQYHRLARVFKQVTSRPPKYEDIIPGSEKRELTLRLGLFMPPKYLGGFEWFLRTRIRCWKRELVGCFKLFYNWRCLIQDVDDSV